MSDFTLSFIQFNEEEYEKLYIAKILRFLELLLPSERETSLHKKERKLHFATTLRDRLNRFRQSTEPYVSSCDFEQYGLKVILSPRRNCRQRLRFAVCKIDAALPEASLSLDYTIIGDIDRRHTEPSQTIIQQITDSIDKIVRRSAVAAEPASSSSSRRSSRLYYAMWEGGSASVLVQDFPIASVQISFLMPIILRLCEKYPVLSEGLQAIHFLSSTIGDVLITLIYNHSLSSEWEVVAHHLQKALSSVVFEHVATCHSVVIGQINLIGRSKGQKIIYGQDYILEELVLKQFSPSKVLVYRQIDDGFSNPNVVVNMKVLDWLCVTLRDLLSVQLNSQTLDLLEMYCGNGNHTVALSQIFRRVLAVEINKKLAEAAKENLKLNSIENAEVLACPSASIANRMLGRSKYSSHKKVCHGKLETLHNNILAPRPTVASCETIEYEFSAVLVDPPRAGLDAVTIQAIRQYALVIYISCNPDKLLENIAELADSHQIEKIGIFDHFAYTPHLEVGAILTRREGFPDF